jgi:hypothetical protein
MVHQDNPNLRGTEEHAELPHQVAFTGRRAEARPLPQESPTSLQGTPDEEDDAPERLGLSPDISRLPREIRDTIRLGGNRGGGSRDEARVAVCAAMFRAGYGAADIWTVMTDPLNGISADFFEQRGDLAEIALEQIISTAHEMHTDG